MPYTDDAKAILQRASEDLRSLLARAVEDQSYEEVAAIARIAEQLSRLVNGHGPRRGTPDTEGVGTDEEFDVHENVPDERAPAVYPRRQRSRHKTLPRFERDGDRLVKISWSKRARAEYEHRAPRDVVFFLLDAIRRAKGEGATFEASHVLPLMDGEREIPSYQTYLALAWLREEGIVKKKGRNGYVLKPNTATREFIEELFSRLPTMREG